MPVPDADPRTDISRTEVCQAMLDLFDHPDYLEVGVAQGLTFLPLRARSKVAVDPAFNFDTVAAARADPTATFHQVPSDDYFLKIAQPRTCFDVIYLDGLHTYEQTLRDLNNALLHLREGGVIVVDDVLPTTYGASLPDLGRSDALRRATAPFDLAWMGDVYRLVFFVEQFMPGLSYATVSQNHGQLVLWRTPRPIGEARTVEWVSRREFADCVLSRDVFRLAPLSDIVRRVAANRRGQL